MLLGERVGERRPRNEAALDDDLAQAPAGPGLLFESLGKLLLVEEAGGNEDPAELRCWNLSRVHDSSIGLDPRFVRATRGVGTGRETRCVIGEELGRLSTWGERRDLGALRGHRDRRSFATFFGSADP